MEARSFSRLLAAAAALLLTVAASGCVPRDRLNEMSGLPGFDKAAFDVVGRFQTSAYGEAKVRRLKVTGQYDIEMGGSTLPLNSLSTVSDVQVYPSKTESLIVMQGSTWDCPVAVRAYRFENRLYKLHALGNCRDKVQVHKAADGTYTLATGGRPDDLLWQWAPERSVSRMVGPVTVASQAPSVQATQIARVDDRVDEMAITEPAEPAVPQLSSGRTAKAAKPRRQAGRQASEVSDLLLPGAKLGASTKTAPRQRLDPNAVAVPEAVATATDDTSQPATWDVARTGR